MIKHRFPLSALVPVILAAVAAGCATAPEREEGSASSPDVASTQAADAPTSRPASPLVVRADRPERYVVQPGDTLWGVAARFLRDPWRWPELWQGNPQIRNPHLIYPGDVLSVTYIDGKPQMRVQRGGEVHLSPKIRVEDLNKAIPTISIEAIHQFLTGHRIVGETELEQSPYIVAFADEHIAGGAGDSIYVRKIEQASPRNWVILRKGATYADDGEVLGYEGIHIGDAELVQPGDPATLLIRQSRREVALDDRVLPSDGKDYQRNFMPHPPAHPVKGHILGIIDGIARIGKFQVAAIGLGAHDGMDQGTVLTIKQKGDEVRDQLEGGEAVTMPDERAGVLMVFRVYDRVSYALVMEARNIIRLGDVVQSPSR